MTNSDVGTVHQSRAEFFRVSICREYKLIIFSSLYSTAMLELARSRRAYLTRMLKDPAWKRDLIDDLDDSRSTVDRVVTSLEDARLIRKTESGFVTTHTGRLMLDTVEEATAAAQAATEGAELLNHLPIDAPRNHRFLIGADVVSMDQESPATVYDRLADKVESAERLRAGAISANNNEFIQLILENTLDSGTLSIRCVITAEVLRHIAAEFPERIDQVIAHNDSTITIVEQLPFAWYVLDDGERQTANLVIHGPYDNFLGYITNDHPAAVEWLDSLLATRERAGTPLAEYER